jgi:hypothetical protein
MADLNDLAGFVNRQGFAWRDLIGQGLPSGVWTPVLTFETPGDLSVSYSSQIGSWTAIDRMVFATFQIVTSAFTHTTATGALTVTGLPFTVNSLVNKRGGSLVWQGITKANYTHVIPTAIASSTMLQFNAMGSGQAATTVQAADTPTGGNIILAGTAEYFV